MIKSVIRVAQFEFKRCTWITFITSSYHKSDIQRLKCPKMTHFYYFKPENLIILHSNGIFYHLKVPQSFSNMVKLRGKNEMAMISLIENLQIRTKFKNDQGILKQRPIKSFQYFFADLLH